jgi:hypothetical protein
MNAQDSPGLRPAAVRRRRQATSGRAAVLQRERFHAAFNLSKELNNMEPDMTMRTFNRLAWAAVAAVAMTACSSTSLRVGGAPDASVKNCVTAAARELRVPAGSIAVDSGSTPRDGVYTINLKVGPQGRSAVCTTDENSAVLGVVYKRPE